MTRPVLGVELVTLELSCNKSRSDSVFPVVQIPACCQSLLAESRVHIHYLVHCKFCESFKFLQLGLRRLLSLRLVSKRVLSNYSAGSSSSVPDIVTPATITLRTSICELSPRGTSNVVGSAARLVGVDDLIRAFGVAVGNTVDVGTTFAPITVCG